MGARRGVCGPTSHAVTHTPELSGRLRGARPLPCPARRACLPVLQRLRRPPPGSSRGPFPCSAYARSFLRGLRPAALSDAASRTFRGILGADFAAEADKRRIPIF